MKRSLIALFFIFIVGAIYAQMPIILESDLKKLQDDAATKVANSGRDQMRASFGGSSSSSYSQDDNQAQTENNDEVDNTKNEVVSEPKKATTTSKEATQTSSARDEYIKRYRDRQKKARGK